MTIEQYREACEQLDDTLRRKIRYILKRKGWKSYEAGRIVGISGANVRRFLFGGISQPTWAYKLLYLYETYEHTITSEHIRFIE